MAPKTPAKTADKGNGEGRGKAARFEVEDQYYFLLECIRYSNNGKIDFQKVADAVGSVSKGAAAKRYERLMKAAGLHATSTPQNPRDVSLKSAPRAKPKTPKGKGVTKKRKLDKSDSPEDSPASSPPSSPGADEDIGGEMSPLKKEEQPVSPHTLSFKKEEEEADYKGFNPVNAA